LLYIFTFDGDKCTPSEPDFREGRQQCHIEDVIDQKEGGDKECKLAEQPVLAGKTVAKTFYTPFVLIFTLSILDSLPLSKNITECILILAS